MSNFGPPDAMAAVHEFLTDSNGFNARLATYRTDNGIAAGALPNVAKFEQWRHKTKTAQTFPYMSIVIVRMDPELVPRSRFYDHNFQLTLVVLDKNITAGEVDVIEAGWRYVDVWRLLHDRRVPNALCGQTLNNGGTLASSRVAHATLGPARLLRDVELGNRTNVAMQASLRVRMITDF